MITRFATLTTRLSAAFALLFTIAACGGGNGGGGFFPDDPGEPITIITTALPSAVDGITYVQLVNADGGELPYSWTVLDDGNTGLTINNEGVLTGTPPKAGDYGITLQVADSASSRDKASFVLTVTEDPQPLAIATAADGLPAAEEGKEYLALLEAVGGAGDYQWAMVSNGTSGLKLRQDGLLNGTAPQEGQYAITVSVVDGTGIATATGTLILTVTAQSSPLKITTTSLGQGTVGERFAAVLAASGGDKPYTWTLISDGGQSGLRLSNGGVLSGTPTQPGTFAFEFRVSDGINIDQSAIPLEIEPAGGGGEALAIITMALPDIMGSTSYAFMVQATGGTQPYTWGGEDETVPSTGFTMDPSTGIITGVTSGLSAGTFGYGVNVMDSAGASAAKSYVITKP
jgi:hypothetical protein